MRPVNWGERFTDIYIALMLAIFPFYVDGDYTTLSAGKYQMFLLLCGGYVLVMTVLAVLGSEKRPRCVAERWAFLYLLLTVLSAAFSPHEGVWLGNGRYEGALTIAIYVLTFLFVARFGRSKEWHMHLLGIGVGVYEMICLWQIAGGNPLHLYPDGLDFAGGGEVYNGVFLGTMGNAGLTGAWLSLALPMLLAAAWTGGRAFRWLLLPAAAGMAVVALMGVSAAVLGVFGSLLLVLPVLTRKENAVKVKTFTYIAIILFFSAIYLVPLPGMLGEAHEILHGTVSDGFGSGRIGIWRQLLEILPEQWLIGSGPDTVGLLKLVPFTGENAAGESVARAVDVAHNEYLQIAVCQGIPALAAYGGLLFSLWRGWRYSGNAAARVLGCGILGYCIQSFFSFSMFITAPLFWLALGLLAAVCNQRR